MRGQQGPCLTPGNYPAARRYVRSRKPPPIILWSIGIITCLLFIGAAIMLTVGYLNPFGTVGLAILGVGAVVYFGAILFLVLSCLWVERKYPGMQPLSFKIYSRKPNRMPPTTFTNPHMSGQMPADTTPAYTMHNEIPGQIPGFNNVAGKTEKIPSTPKDKSPEKNDNNPPNHGSSQDRDRNSTIQSTALDVLPEGDYNGGIGEGNSSNIRLQELTNNDNVTMNEEKRDNLINATGMEEKPNSQPEQNTFSEGAAKTHGVTWGVQHNQSENNNNVSSSPERERKVKLKTHHIEVPFEDYPSSDSSISLTNKKDQSQDKKPILKKSNLKANSQHINSPIENGNASKSTSTSNATAMDKQKEVPSSVNDLSHTKDTHLHQRAKPADKDIKQESSNLSNTELTADARKRIAEKQDSSQLVRNVIPTNSALPIAVSKTAELESHASKPANPVQKDSAPTASPISHSKLLKVQKDNATNSDHALESVQEKSQTTSLLKIGKNMLPQNNNPRHEKQAVTSPKHRTKNPRSSDVSPTRAQKTQSPDRARKIRKDNAVPNSPPINRKVDASSSPTRHHKKKPDHFSKAERTQEQSTTIQTVSSSGRREEIQKKKILHSSPSSQSSDLPPSSSSSSSPSRHRHSSPNKSPRLPRNGDHTSRTTTFHSSRHSSPSSQSSDVPSSTSSSPQRTRQKSPDLSTKMQRHKHTLVTSVVASSSNRKDEQHKRHSQPSSQSSDALSSPTSSPLSAKKLLQSKKEQTNQNQSVPQKRSKE